MGRMSWTVLAEEMARVRIKAWRRERKRRGAAMLGGSDSRGEETVAIAAALRCRFVPEKWQLFRAEKRQIYFGLLFSI